jgi:hypothetical protein
VRCDPKGKAEWIVLRPETTKTDRMRTIPVSERLAKQLKRGGTGPDGEPHALDAYVFGNAVGERLDSIKTAWKATCRRAGIARDEQANETQRNANGPNRQFEAGGTNSARTAKRPGTPGPEFARLIGPPSRLTPPRRAPTFAWLANWSSRRDWQA